MAIKNVFTSTLPSCRFIFKGGKEAPFINGEYYTNDEIEIKELEAEIAASHPFISVNSEKKTIDTDKLDPLETIKQAAIAEYLAKQAASNSKDNNRGISVQTKLTVANSTTIADAAAGSGT